MMTMQRTRESKKVSAVHKFIQIYLQVYFSGLTYSYYMIQ